jgi:hypothetical protein
MTTANQPDLSPAPGIIPGPAHVTSGAIPLTAGSERAAPSDDAEPHAG